MLGAWNSNVASSYAAIHSTLQINGALGHLPRQRPHHRPQIRLLLEPDAAHAENASAPMHYHLG
jgi:hypothetical protein